MFFPHRLVLASIFIACCLTTRAFGRATLLNEEVKALKSIGRTLGKRNWNFDVDPCSEDPSWLEIENFKDYDNNVTCNCSFSDNTTCHVISIRLKSQNLQGTLPPELVRLHFLQEIDLSRNFLSGKIPPEWGSMKLIKISLLGNRLTGLIPMKLADISTLTTLVLEGNHFSGNLPPELANLPNIQKMQLSSNNFSGELPPEFARLTTMKDFRISDNNFTGNIPNFIFQNWTKLAILGIQASGLSGPIPAIVGLPNLSDLRISNLNGAETTSLNITDLPKLKTLILKSCNLVGQPPNSLGASTDLKIFDLSFNRLNGTIGAPPDIHALRQMFLTGNSLTGAIPEWILKANKDIDLSYNNFTRKVSDCQRGRLNLFASTSGFNNSGNVTCFESPGCPAEPLYSLHINCGGSQEIVNDITYEADHDNAGPSTFLKHTTWATSSTGVFLDNNDERDNFVIELSNNRKLSKSDFQLYSTARISSISLTYYAYCLRKNRTYNVSLHFAEIQFTDDNTFSSLGRRIFDVYIQGRRALTDFNIKDEAGGVCKPILKNFTVQVTDGTLEIRLQWAGKGTTVIPTRGVYGPLISAISIVDPDYRPPSDGISASVVVGIVAGAASATFLVLGIHWWNDCLRKKSTLERDLKGIELQTSFFTLRQIKAATNNFDASNKIGEGGFGPVYKGTLADGTVIAVKQLSAKSKQGNCEFLTEIGTISGLQHPHLVKLHGCCIEGNQLLLIYEYLQNNSLARALFGPEEFQLKLDWPTRRKICIGMARGLAYLHEESRFKVVHRDIKATNVLLDKNLNPKISDFGLAKLYEEDNTHVSSQIVGTYGYMAPEYAMHGRLSDKADVYSFGIVALEIVSGRCNTKDRSKEDSFYLIDLAHFLKEKGSLMDLIDPKIGYDCNVEEAMMIALILQLQPGLR